MERILFNPYSEYPKDTCYYHSQSLKIRDKIILIMPTITLIHKPTFTNIHPYPREGINDKIAVWGPLHGGNLSLKNSLVVADPVLGDAFVQSGAEAWNVPNFKGEGHTTPHGGSNFRATLIGVPLQQAIDFFAAHGYEVEDEEQFIDENEDQIVEPVVAGVRAPKNQGGNNERAVPEFLSVTMEQLLTKPAVNPDQDWYQRIVDVFTPANRFQAIKGTTAAQIRKLLPEGFGTYVVRDRDEKLPSASILYIGMAGTLKIKGEALVPGGGGLRSRLGRITPYCHSAEGPWANHFEF